MKNTPEGKVKTRIKKRLDSMGAWYFMPVAGIMGRIGIPDFIGCYNGRFFAIEAKAGKGKVTLMQERVIGAIVAAGGLAHAVNETSADTFNLEKLYEGDT